MVLKTNKKYVRIPAHSRKVGEKTVKIRAHIRKMLIPKKIEKEVNNERS